MENAANLKFIVALTEHRHLGMVFVPYLVEPLSAYYSVRYIVRPEETDNMAFAFSAAEKEIVRLSGKYADSRISARFSRSKNSTEFFGQVSPEYLTSHVFPYVSKYLFSVAQILMNQDIPLFFKEPKYANLYDEDRIMVSDCYASARYLFERTSTGTRYEVRLFLGDEPVPLKNRKVRLIANDPCVMMVRDRLLVFRDMDSRKVQPFLDRDSIFVPVNVEPKYYSNFVFNMVRDHEVEAHGFVIREPEGVLTAAVSLERNLKNTPALILRLIYGDTEILPNDKREVLVKLITEGDGYTFLKYRRNRQLEQEISGFLTGAGLQEEAGCYVLPNSGLPDSDSVLYALVEWLSRHREDLAARNVEIRQTFFEKHYHTGNQEVTFDLRQKSDWFDLYATVTFGPFRIPFIKLRKYILNGIREFELPDGQIAILPEEWFEHYRQLIQAGRAEGDRLVFDRHFYHLLKERIPGQSLTALLEFQEKIKQSEQAAVPAGLKATLRSYQLTGFRWMHSLISNGMGGCLADDMGLGKTLQALALLLSLKREPGSGDAFREQTGRLNNSGGQLSLFDEPSAEASGQPASLIVVPTSLVHNWINEIRKFAPSLKVYVHTGNLRRKNGDFSRIAASYDAVITTYGVLRNDRELFDKVRFFITILDESQYIKNKTSKTFGAVMALKSYHHLVLTGTPVENSLADLWSQMNFLNRGLLGSYPFFRQQYQLPIENHSEEKAGEKLQLLIRPFILRRTKDEVAGELPPLVETVMYCTMAPEQQTIYEREKSLIRNTILATIGENGLAASSIEILRGLTRLRQLANHPTLAGKDDNSGSGKFEEIFMALSGLVSENHKVLIFSSFVSHLELIRKRIESENWKYSLLTGKTRNREEVISEFQDDPENKIFLISLKAGGVGLNLTRADYVFIIDPWWNPASENQAISRAHRIGQDRHVFVYRFITENSIEEKIEMLKERKSALADKFINSNNPFRAISREEIAALFE